MIAPIHPAIIAQSETEFVEKLRAVERVAPLVHLDVMDGKFVPNTTWADPFAVERMKTPAKFEVHLMVEEPFREVILWGKLKRVQRIIVHVESTQLLRELLHTIRATGKKVGLALNPGTRISNLKSQISNPLAALLLMANDPGFAGRPFQKTTLRRIAALRKQFPRLPIGVDIGMNAETLPLVRRAGATFAIVGTAIFGTNDPAATYRALVKTFAK